MDPAYMLRHFEVLYGDESDGAEGHAKRLRAPSARGYFYQLLAGMGWTSLPFLPFMNRPTLILAGENDQIVPLVNAKILAQVIPDARLETVSGGHLFLVSQMAEILPMIRSFLDEEPERRPFEASASRGERRFRGAGSRAHPAV